MSGFGNTAIILRGVLVALAVVFAATTLLAQPLPPGAPLPPLDIPKVAAPPPLTTPTLPPLTTPTLPPLTTPTLPPARPTLPPAKPTLPPLTTAPSLVPGAEPTQPSIIVSPSPSLIPHHVPYGNALESNGSIVGMNPQASPYGATPLSTNFLPGSAEDEYQKELAAREGFRRYTWEDAYVSTLPPTLLWEPPLAVNRDPRMKAIYSNQPNFRGSNSLETSIGGTVGLIRYTTAGHDLKYQIDIFGVVNTRLSPEDVIVADYRFGLPFTFQWNWWSGKIGYEHTSSHLGDRLIRATGQQINSQAKDEVVAGLSRIIYDNWRVYGQMAYAFFDLNVDRRPGPFRADVGFEWYMRQPTGFWGTPFVAGNVEWRQDQDYVPNYNAQVGWMWRNPYQRFGNCRLYAQYYSGASPYYQFYNQRENFAAFGLAFDY